MIGFELKLIGSGITSTHQALWVPNKGMALFTSSVTLCQKLTPGVEQVDRIVASAGEITQDSEDLFERIRQGREDGKYWRKIMVFPLLSGNRETTGVVKEQYSCATYYSVPIREGAVSVSIEDKLVQYAKQKRMRRTQGEYPFVRFSRRFLNHLCERKGLARLSTALLTTWIFQQRRRRTAQSCCDLVVLLASGRADALSGRFFTIKDDMVGLVERSGSEGVGDSQTLRLMQPS